MQSFILDRHTDPSNPTLKVTQDDKIPIYDTKADAEADIANIEENSIVATKDTGATEKVVDVVRDGNMNPVTSNAVADCLKYSTDEIVTGKTWIDGRPIYRKVIHWENNLSSPTSLTESTQSHGISDIRLFTSVEGTLRSSDANVSIPAIYSSSEYVGRIKADSSEVSIRYIGTWSSYRPFIILEYTKTTD